MDAGPRIERIAFIFTPRQFGLLPKQRPMLDVYYNHRRLRDAKGIQPPHTTHALDTLGVVRDRETRF